jgi:hypothetical protein
MALFVQGKGLLPSSVSIPAAGRPPTEVTGTEAPLPEDFGQVVVYRSSVANAGRTVESAQHALVLVKRAVAALVVVAIVVAGVAVLLAPDRRRATYRLGLAVGVSSLLVVAIVNRVADSLPDVASTPGSRAIVAALTDRLRDGLVDSLVALVVVGALAAAGARLGPRLLAWAQRHLDAARIAVVAFGAVVLLALGSTWAAFVLAAVITAAGLLALAFVSRSKGGIDGPSAPTTDDVVGASTSQPA